MSKAVWTEVKDHGAKDAKGRALGHKAFVGQDDGRVWWFVQATRNGVEFGARQRSCTAATLDAAIAAARLKLAQTKAPK